MNVEKAHSYKKHHGLPLKEKLFFSIFIFALGIVIGFLSSVLGLDAIFVFVAFIGALLVFLDTYHGLFVIMIAFPFLVGFSSTVSVSEQAFIVLFGTWFIGWVVRYLLDKSRKINFSWHPVAPPTLAVGALLVTAALMGGLTGASPIDVVRDLSQYVGYLVLLPVAGIIRYRKSALKLLKIAVLIGLPCYIWSSFIWWSRKFGLEYGGMDTMQVGGAYFGPIIGALWPLMLLRTGRRMRTFAALGLFLLLLYMFGSGYRSQIILAVVMTSVAIWGIWKVQSGRRKMIVVIPIALGAVFVLWFIGGTLGYLPLPGGARTSYLYSSLLSPQRLLSNMSIQGRLVEAQAALKVFYQHPLLGEGFGHHVPMQWAHGTWYKTAFSQHIWVTEMLMKFGILGALIFAWFFIEILRFSYTVAKRADSPMVKAIALGVFIWIITSLIPFFGSFSNRGFAFMVGLMVGMLPAFAGLHPAQSPREATESTEGNAILRHE